VHQLPQEVVDSDLDFLDDLWIIRLHHQTMLNGGAGGQRRARTTGQCHREQAQIVGGLARPQDVAVTAILRDPQGNVLGPCQVSELVGEYFRSRDGSSTRDRLDDRASVAGA